MGSAVGAALGPVLGAAVGAAVGAPDVERRRRGLSKIWRFWNMKKMIADSRARRLGYMRDIRERALARGKMLMRRCTAVAKRGAGRSGRRSAGWRRRRRRRRRARRVGWRRRRRGRRRGRRQGRAVRGEGEPTVARTMIQHQLSKISEIAKTQFWTARSQLHEKEI